MASYMEHMYVPLTLVCILVVESALGYQNHHHANLDTSIGIGMQSISHWYLHFISIALSIGLL